MDPYETLSRRMTQIQDPTPVPAPLRRDRMRPDPFVQFADWFADALGAAQPQANAACLASADRHATPSARMILLKGFDERGFVFYTNHDSQKGRELHENPSAALVFYWHALRRQVRIGGEVDPISRAESEAYFQSRPLNSQLAAWASPQSQTTPDRQALEAAFERILERFADLDVTPLPPFWGGYRLAPRRFEFWQHHEHRFHDRFAYTLEGDGGWRLDRLAP